MEGCPRSSLQTVPSQRHCLQDVGHYKVSGSVALPLRSQAQKVFNFYLLRIVFPSERKASAHPPSVLHAITCARQNVDSQLWISLTIIALTPKKSKLSFLEKTSVGHRPRSNNY